MAENIKAPPLPPRLQNRKMGAMLGNLELRAELEPYLAKNPLARLGYDIITRGEKVGEGPGGEMVAGIVGGPKGFDKYGITKSYYGVMLPSKNYNTPKDTDTGFRFADTDTFFSPSRDPYTEHVLRKQGIMGLLPPEKGTTVYYDTGDDERGRGMDLNTLMEELAHVGMREIQRRGALKDVSLSSEEYLMDIMQGRAAETGGAATQDQKRAYRRPSSYAENLLEESDRLASEALMDRGVPSRVEQRDATIMERLLGFFD